MTFLASKSPRIAVLHSGGLDSTVCLLLARENCNDVVSIGIDYGQRHRIELEYATFQCQRFGIPRKVIEVKWDKPSRELPIDRTVDEMRATVSPAFLPGRNLVFLSLGLAESAGIEATELWIGVNSVDFSGYPDCKPEFIDAFARMSGLGIPNGPRVVAPLQYLTKPQIATKAMQLGLTSTDTWSCYRPMFANGGLTICGHCDACKLHLYAWQSLSQNAELG